MQLFAILPLLLEPQTWDSWPHERLFYVYLAVAFLAVWVQVTLLHWRGAFRSPYMWGPVIYTPILVVSALLLAFYRVGWTEVLFVVTFGIGVFEGLFGAYKHFGGVKSHIGGFTLRNFIQGPPAVLPVIYAAVALFGLIMYYWNEINPASVL